MSVVHNDDGAFVSRLDFLLAQHLHHVESLRTLLSWDTPIADIVDLTAIQPAVSLDWAREQDKIKSVGVINTQAVPVSLGWTGFPAALGLGIPVPAHSYLVLPLEINLADVAAPASSIAEDSQVTVVVLRWKKPQRLSAGSLGIVSSAGVSALTSESPGAVSVGTASGLVLPANNNRNAMQYVNSSANTISLGLGTAAVAGQGIVLEGSGGAWDGTLSGKLWLGAVYAIASAAASNLAVVEA